MSVINRFRTFADRIGLFYVRLVCWREFKSQKFIGINERPIEFSFLFRKLTELWPKKVLDVGTGKTALPHLVRNCGFEVTAIDNIRDYWPKGMINRHYHVLDDDITKTSLTESYDLIMCISVLEHIQDYCAAIRSMHRLLKIGGDLIITFPYNNQNYCSNVYDLAESSVEGKFSFKTQSFSRVEVSDWVKQFGFEILEQEYWDFFDGDYWTCGNRLERPVKVGEKDRHQLTCVHFRKMSN
jgi:SAM-dependent methyltransferase